MMNSRRTFLRNSIFTGLFYTCHGALFARSQSGKGWTRKASLPVNVQEIYATVLEGRIHTGGGFVFSPGQTGVSDKHLVYHPVTNLWEEVSTLPEPRHHLQLVAYGGRVYGLGGFMARNADAVWEMQNQTWSFDPAAGEWSEMKQAPELHGETVAASLQDQIHVIGGRKPGATANATWNDHTDTDQHLVFDPKANTWEKGAPAPSSRNSAAGAVIDERLYVVGGRTVTGGNVNTLEIYDPKEDRWETARPMPKAQGGLAAAAVKGKLYAFGGEYFDQGGGVYPECWIYDPQRDAWSEGPDMLTPRHGLAGVAVNNTIYAIAGAKKAGGNETSNILESFTVGD